MFWIYGGGFVEGYASPVWFGGDHFMDKGVILVTFNYRIGPFGMLLLICPLFDISNIHDLIHKGRLTF